MLQEYQIFIDEKPAQGLVKYAKEKGIAPIGLTQEEKERFKGTRQEYCKD